MSIPLEAAGSFCPGSLNHKISTYPSFKDAADNVTAKEGEDLEVI